MHGPADSAMVDQEARFLAGSRAALALMRPRHAIKNGFVAAPLLFSGRAVDSEAVLATALAFVIFSIAQSGTYAWNDVRDRFADQRHPTKRRRPVASGQISVRRAIGLGVVLVAASLGFAWLWSPAFAIYPTLYVVFSLAYSWRLKHVVILDVFVIAGLFLIRLLGGASAVRVVPSEWLLVCGGLLAIFLAFSKRRHELVLMAEDAGEHRAVIDSYTLPFLDQALTISMALSVSSYFLYTLVAESRLGGGSPLLTYSTVFVLFGFLRYALIVHRGGGDPTQILLTDRPLSLAIGGWAVVCATAIYLG